MYILFAIISGITVLINMLMLGKMTKQAGLFPSTFVNFASGTAGSLLLLYFIRDLKPNGFENAPIYLYLGALVMMIVTMLNGILINKIPAVFVTILMLIGQLAAGIVIDFFRSGKLSFGDILGGIVILAGLIYNSSFDKKEQQDRPV